MQFKKTLGLEIHAQIDTKTKLFSRALVDDSALPNSQVDFLDAGFPGTLPVPNETAIHMALKTSLALNMSINQISVFDRKHYFYQDLPLGYQITQFYKPIGVNGYIECSFGKVRINRLHIECDAGKSIYQNGHTHVDLNRSGVPLMEIVTEPDFCNEDQVIEFLKELRAILLSIKTCRCDMEKGNFRVDVNLSVAPEGYPLGTRVEIKNLNSYNAIKKAINFEEKFQIETINSGQLVAQETKLFDSEKNITKSMRDKENAAEYAYFPDPDLLPIYIEESLIEKFRKNLPILPQQLREILIGKEIAIKQAFTLTETLERFDFFNNLMENLPKDLCVKVSNWVCCELLGKLSKLEIELEYLLKTNKNFTKNFSIIIDLCEKNEITRSIAKVMLDEIIKTDLCFDVLFENSHLLNKTYFDLHSIVLETLNDLPDEIEKYKKGKVQIVMYFVGLIMKKTDQKCDAQEIKEIVIKELNKR